jgi:3-phenylpropionate/trans-cinnamate dioxygenase ferredoxin reductase component
VDLLLGERATAIDREAKRVTLEGGEMLPYDHLVLATGARNRRPPVPGLDHHDVIELRTLADANKIVGVIGGWKRVCVIGGGFIGLEAAGLLATMGVKIDVVEMAPRLMQRAVSPAVSAWFLEYHLAQGTRVHLSTQVKAVEHGADCVTVVLDNGEPIEADAVVLAAGVVPNAELAAAAGLKVDNGIVVDELLVTSDPAISAVGDCAFYPSRHLPGMARLESVQNATDQGKAVAARIMGEAKAYDALPWFWSIQGEARLQIAGLSKQGLSEVVRGDPASGKFSVFLYEGERLASVESVNAPGEHMAARRLIAAGTKVDPETAANTSIEMKSLIAAA